MRFVLDTPYGLPHDCLQFLLQMSHKKNTHRRHVYVTAKSARYLFT